MEKKNNSRTYILMILGVIGTILLVVGVTYAYWILTKQQTGENVVNSACLNISFTGENDINLPKAYPMSNEQLDKFLSTATPYHFTIHNECNELATATINLESLNAGEEKQLQDQYINAILYETDYHNNLNSVKQLIESIYNDENKVLEDSLHAYKLYNFTLKKGETKNFNLQLYMDANTPMEEANMNASWKGKITLSTEYTNDKFINAGTIRTISSSDSNGMWKYKINIKQIVIEDSKKRKTSDNKVVYGPFDESAKQDNSIESYVVCEIGDANCVGYLQGDGGVKANSDSSNLFNGYSNVTDIIGLENLDTSNVIIMMDMFDNMSSLSSIDLSSFNTSNVSNMFEMFKDCSSITNLDLSAFDTSHVINIAKMFSNMASLQELNLSNWKLNDALAKDFSSVTWLQPYDNVEIPLKTIILNNVDTANVTTVENMFSDLNNLETLDLSAFDTDNLVNMNGMIFGSNKLQTLNLSNWNFNKVTIGFGGSENAFGPGAPSSLQTIILNNVKTDEVTDMTNLFLGLSNLQSLDLNSFDTSNVTNMASMFNGCSGLTSLDLSMFDTTKLTSTTAMFYSMNSLTELNISNWKFNDSIAKSFASNSGLSNNSNFNSLILENVNTSNVTNMDSMFMSLPVTSLNLSSFDTSNVTNMRVMFGFMSNLQNLNISNFDTNLVNDMSAMFITDGNLTDINYGENFTHNPSVVITSMFSGTDAPRPPHSSWQGVSFE